MGEEEFTYWVELPAGTKHVVFEDLPHLIATALWPQTEPQSEKRDFSYGGARINLEEELPKAVSDGRLLVRDPLTLGHQTFPVGEALRQSFVLLHDLRSFLALRGGSIGVRLREPYVPSLIPPDSEFVPIGLVAKDCALREHPLVADENGTRRDVRNAMRETTEKDFVQRLSAYLKQGKLKAINPVNGAPYDSELPHLDEHDPMWSLSNGEREKALELLGQLKRTNEAGLSMVSLQSLAAHASDTAAKEFRQTRRGYFLNEAAEMLASQQGESDSWAKAFWQRMEAAGALPDGHKLRLTVRDPHTGLVELAGTRKSRSLVVRPADVNAWLDAQGESYSWDARIATPNLSESESETENETPTARQDRRLARLRDLGDNMRLIDASWQTVKRSGALAALEREEREAGRPMRDKTNIRQDLAAAAERELKG